MSTSATQSGTTTRRSGKGLGFAAAALAVVIAAGFVFALNQGHEATVSNAVTRPNPATEIERLNDLALKVKAAQHPAFNIERTKMAMAGQLIEHPGVSPEKTRMDYLTEKLGEVLYVPSIVQAVPGGSWSEGNLDLIRAQAKAQQPSELQQPEWDNRMP